MADTKITALTALTAADPSTDVLPIVDTSDTTMAASGTTKKISINNILGASGTATLASATISGDLTVDTSTLKVDSANNRVGIGTASPDSLLQMAGAGTINWKLSNTADSVTVGAYSGTTTGTTGTVSNHPFFLFTNNTERYRLASDGVATWSNVGGVAGTAMTLNSTGLGVGVSPGYKLDVAGSSAGVLRLVNISNSSTDPAAVTRLSLDGQGATWHLDNERTNGIFKITRNSTACLTIDNSGNVGIGVTPSAWGSNYKSIDLVGGGRVFTVSGTGTHGFSFNAFNNNTNWLYQFTTVASRFELQQSGNFAWLTAPSGTAGTAITFTQAMTLTAAGNLAVGVAATGNRLDVQNSTDCTVLVKSTGANANIALDYISNYGNHTIRKSGTAVWDFGVINDATATPAFKVSNASAVGVQLVSGATSWTTLSDETMKDIIEPISNAVAKVGSLRSVIGKFKTDDSNKRRSFLIAQDVQSVLPEAIDVIGENNELGLRYTEVIPLLVAAIKELTARVQTLETR